MVKLVYAVLMCALSAVSMADAEPGRGPAVDVSVVAVAVAAPHAASQTQAGPYTGLIVDCRGIKIWRTMGPRIYDTDGRDVWGLVKMDYGDALGKGKAGYYKSVEQAKSMRVGDNPLIVKAVAATGNKYYPPDAVISVADGALVKSENEKYHFLEKYSAGLLVD